MRKSINDATTKDEDALATVVVKSLARAKDVLSEGSRRDLAAGRYRAQQPPQTAVAMQTKSEGEKARLMADRRMPFVPVLILVFGVYSVPLVVVLLSALLSKGFSSEIRLVYFSKNVCELYTGSLAVILGNLLTPLVTAMSVEVKAPGKKLPASTRWILLILGLLLAASWALHALVATWEAAIKNYGEDAFRAFQEVTASHAKETLAYVALAVGIAYRKVFLRKESD